MAKAKKTPKATVVVQRPQQFRITGKPKKGKRDYYEGNADNTYAYATEGGLMVYVNGLPTAAYAKWERAWVQ